MSSSTPIPIILCGRSPVIATSVKEMLLPEYEVIHIILSPEAGVSEIPKVLRGEISTNSDSQDQAQIGTKNYSTLPAAVILGGAYDYAAIESMREACKGCDAKIPWLRADVSKPSPPLGPAYGPHIVGRAKECMKELVENGKLEGDGVYYY